MKDIRFTTEEDIEFQSVEDNGFITVEDIGFITVEYSMSDIQSGKCWISDSGRHQMYNHERH